MLVDLNPVFFRKKELTNECHRFDSSSVASPTPSNSFEAVVSGKIFPIFLERSENITANYDYLPGAYVDFKQIVVKPNMTAGSALQSDAVFAGIKDRVAENEAKAKAINAVFLYKITEGGKVAKEWVLDLKNAKVYEGAVQGGKADTTMTIADGDMVELALGKLQPQTAFMKGKLKITGNIMLAQKLAPLLKTEAKL
ncbi:peroxisomal multifunctional enzyme type 2-like isoform X2 [Anopheles aquasalis]|uniref:peroxisomal multifunctional enzyme type 2-like isoform X2 n=1 Tax=Anopheles aquasalis TaxID=42839 RepID=UPI00215AF8A9|nr:peroxisomal multifunctional enzyme type 2-like isoform X2 [Anopheles aquasalis]